jgi:hypothetical protein
MEGSMTIWVAFGEQVMAWLEEHGCFSVERLFRDFCGVFRYIATPRGHS